MSVKSGFFNSIGNDRLYNAIDMGKQFDGLIHDGVFATLGDHMMVTAKGGYRITVGTGKAWFNHTWTIVDSVYGLTLEPADSILKRIDIVVLEVNNSDQVRANSIKILKGAPSANPVRPTMIRSDRVNQYPLAFIDIPNGISSISQANITNAIGSSDCPFVTAVNQSVTVDELVQQWKYQFDDFMKTNADAFRAWQEAEKQSFDDWERAVQFEFEEWRNNQKHDFDEWWAGIIDLLVGVPVAEHAVRILQIEKDIAELNRHVDTFEDYGQHYYQTLDYEPHRVQVKNGSYGDLNANEYLVPGTYTFSDHNALKNTNHAPCHAICSGSMKVYDPGGNSVAAITAALTNSALDFRIVQELEYNQEVYIKFIRHVVQTNGSRTFSKWKSISEDISKKNVNVETGNWVASGIDKMPYKANIQVNGIDSGWYADVYFDKNAILSEKLAGFTDTDVNTVIIYAREPINASIPLIIAHHGYFLDSEVIK